ncbi:MAG TPA: formate dehydrogenase accessory sulfurtransferase FdhD [Candidatus Binataceae bacterium]|nr:formate dehydrogenase accessory sulfurtransferase FdhD [Candidatus Binataceae bacterium]
MNESVKQHHAVKWRAGSTCEEPDRLAVEEPLEIRLGGKRFTLTMRTPGHDEELAAGFLLAEGFVNARGELDEIRRLRDSKGALDPNAIDVILSVPAAGLRERMQRNFAVSSSCGICGKTSIEALERRLAPLTSCASIAASALLRLPALMREAQAVFAATGGLHAAALFELESDQAPALVVLREDVGRHNAVDKVIGFALAHDLVPLARHALMVSGRLSFEIVQKAAAAGIPILSAVSAPSSLAVELAEELGMTLVGFLRESNFNIYTHAERVLTQA